MRLFYKINNFYGNTVTIAHVINGKKYETLYAHLSAITVKLGQVVEQGKQIGVKGSTGNNIGIHLHFEINDPAYAVGQPYAVNSLHFIVDSSVMELQKLLSEVGYPLVVDGIAGPATETAIKAFQIANGLIVDGIAGPATLAALNKAIELQKEGTTVAEQKLTDAQEAIRQEAIRLKITDGKDLFRFQSILFMGNRIADCTEK